MEVQRTTDESMGDERLSPAEAHHAAILPQLRECGLHHDGEPWEEEPVPTHDVLRLFSFHTRVGRDFNGNPLFTEQQAILDRYELEGGLRELYEHLWGVLAHEERLEREIEREAPDTSSANPNLPTGATGRTGEYVTGDGVTEADLESIFG